MDSQLLHAMSISWSVQHGMVAGQSLSQRWAAHTPTSPAKQAGMQAGHAIPSLPSCSLAFAEASQTGTAHTLNTIFKNKLISLDSN